MGVCRVCRVCEGVPRVCRGRVPGVSGCVRVCRGRVAGCVRGVSCAAGWKQCAPGSWTPPLPWAIASFLRLVSSCGGCVGGVCLRVSSTRVVPYFVCRFPRGPLGTSSFPRLVSGRCFSCVPRESDRRRHASSLRRARRTSLLFPTAPPHRTTRNYSPSPSTHATPNFTPPLQTPPRPSGTQHTARNGCRAST